ncbi:MAG TPA: glycosyltransferase [Pirellulales bacterium]|nr:glycosyltransferase [Pirellulales bacterium]
MPTLNDPVADPQLELAWPRSDIVSLPPLRSVVAAQRYYLETRRTIRAFARTVDRLIMRLPFQIPSVLRHLNVPKAIHIVSDPVEIVRVSTDYRGLMGFLARRFARHAINSTRRLAAEPNTRTITNGEALWKQLRPPAGRVIVSASLYEREMIPRADRQLHDPPRLLFVGWLRPEKGIHTLLSAFEALRRTRPLKLTIAGGLDRATGTELLVQQRIKASAFATDIELRGSVPFGPELFELYRTHDIYVLPSFSEGTPRTLVEARAFGCPVVATTVGGIPSSIRDGFDGILVPPGDDAQLATALRTVLDNETLRVSLIQNGIERARAFSVEAFVRDLVAETELAADAAPSRLVAPSADGVPKGVPS